MAGKTLYSLAALCFSFYLFSCAPKAEDQTTSPVTYSYNAPVVKIFSPEVEDTVHLMLVADTHLWMSDDREEPFRTHSKRMAGAYHATRHFQTLEATNPEKSFLHVLGMAKEKKVDAIALLGDIVSYPSEYAVEWAKGKLDSIGIPYYYTAGNHDWHYEGMEGSSIELRDTWAKKRLMPLLGPHNPLMYSVDVKWVKLLFIDDSVYEILPEQLDFFRQEDSQGKPMLLMMHIPVYAPGREVGFGVGHPDWNAAHDTSFELERRNRWAAEGHKPETFAFYDAVVSSSNLMATFTGHVHRNGVDVIQGKPFFTIKENASGGYCEVWIIPAPKKQE